MAFDTYSPPHISYGWLPEFDNSGRTITLRSNQWLAILPRMADRTNGHYLGVGITHLIQNTGQIDTSVDRSKRAVMNQADFLTKALDPNGVGNYNFASWTETQINNAIDAYYSEPNHQTAFVIDQIAEWLTNHFNYTAWNESTASRLFGTRMQIALTNFGGRFYGGYDGHLDAGRALYGLRTARPNEFGMEDLRGILNWNSTTANGYPLQEAINLLSPVRNDFYINDAHTYRHGAIKIYAKGDPNIFQMTMGFVLSMEVDRKVRQKKNISKRVAVIAFPGYNEDVSAEHWSVRYRRVVNTPSGGKGTITRRTFPMWSYSIQIGVYFLALAMDFDLYCWESEERFGSNPDVIAIPGAASDSYGKDKDNNATVEYAGASDVVTAPPIRSFTTGAVMYPANPQGCMDLPLIAADMYSFITDYVKSFDGHWVRHQVVSAGIINQPYTVLNDDYLVDRYIGEKQAHGMAMVFKNGSKAALFYQNFYLAAHQTETVQVELQVSGPYYTFEAYGGRPYCFRFDLLTDFVND